MNTNTSGTSNTLGDIVEATPPPVATPPPTVAATGKARVAVGSLQRDPDAMLIVESLRVVTGMTGNLAYAAPVPKLAEIIAARNDFITAVNAAKGNTLGVATRRKQRTVLVTLLRNLAHYVQATCGGDLPTLLSSGFTAQRTRRPIGELPAPVNLRLARGKLSGQLIARFDKHAQAGAYEWRFANAATPTVWTKADTTLAANTTLDGLEPGTQYIVQVRAIGTAGPSDWSDAATLMAA
jgi:hypothetical protein